MPLVRIDLVQGRTDAETRELADVVQQCLEDVFAAPARDRYQVITEHRPGLLFLQDTGLGIERSDRQVLLQITQQAAARSRSRRSTRRWPGVWRSAPVCGARTSSCPWSRTPSWTGHSGTVARSS